MSRVCKILLVEDYPEVRELLGGVLEMAGYEFTAVASAAEMRQELANDIYDIVVIDIGLPGREDGFALAEQAKGPARGIILTTGDHSLGDRLKATGYPHLLKPFAMRALVALAEQVLAAVQANCVRRDVGGPPASPPGVCLD